MKKFLIFILFVFITYLVEAQSFYFRHYTVEDGLPSTEVYSVAQSDDGYIWFATNKGVTRFDGAEMKTFTQNDGLPSNSVIAIYKDYKGRLWFQSYSGDISYFTDNKIIAHPLNDTIKFLSQNYFIDNIYIDQNDKIWIMPILGGIYCIDSLTITDYTDSFRIANNYDLILKNKHNGYIFARFPNMDIHKSEDVLQIADTLLYIRIKDAVGLRKNYVKVSDKEFFVSWMNNLIHIKDGKIIDEKKYDKDITGLFLDNNKNLWVSVLYNGVYMYDSLNLRLQSLHILHGKSPASVFQDNEGNYWIPTIDNGVYFAPSFIFKTYVDFGFGEYNITAMDTLGNNLIFATYDKQIFKCGIQGDKIKFIENIAVHDSIKGTVRDILVLPDKSVWFAGNYLFMLKNKKIKVVEYLSRSYKMAYSKKDNHVLVTMAGGFTEFAGTKKLRELINNYPSTTLSIYKDSKERIWLGSVNGLYSFKDNYFEYWGRLNPLLQNRVDDITEFAGYIVMAISGKGIIFLKDRHIFNINETKGLNSNFVNIIYPQDNKILWVGTNKGLCKILIKNDKNFVFAIETYTSSDGLISEDIKAITVIDNILWLGTSKGLMSADNSKISKKIFTPKVLIDSIMVNDSIILPAKNQTFEPNQRNITFYFKSISFRRPQKIKYRYRLVNFDDNWVTTSNKYVRFPNLPAGKYVFEISASYDAKDWTYPPAKIEFKIKKRFDETVFYSVIIIISVLAVILLIIWIIYKQLQSKIETQRKLMLSEQKALRAQMNPHFIFNSLNSIRSYILENDVETADIYLTNFAYLMRRVLENSKYNVIDLQNEIRTLKYYLDLEKMRFEDTFDYEIIVNTKTKTNEIFIPPMLIQPHLENAIWHGLAPKFKDGKLKLAFIDNGNILFITITDNGIGRKKSAEIHRRRKGHKSMGIINIEERINLINKIYRTKISFKITDLYENDKPAGTNVEIIIPYKIFANSQ